MQQKLLLQQTPEVKANLESVVISTLTADGSRIRDEATKRILVMVEIPVILVNSVILVNNAIPVIPVILVSNVILVILVILVNIKAERIPG